MSQTIEYAALTDQVLVDLLSTEEDRLPRAAADEIIRRGVPIAPTLVRILEDDSAWDAEPSRWWSVVHAAYLLAAMQPPGALDVLLRALDQADEYRVDWISTEARHLLGSFGPRAVSVLKAAAMDPSRGSYPRILINEALGWIGQIHAEARDEVAQALRAAVADNSAESDVQAFAACELLEFAFPEDRDLILSAADDWIFNEEDVRDVYDRKIPRPERPGNDWLQFYDDEEIARRQERWREEDRRREEWKDGRRLEEAREVVRPGIRPEETAPEPLRAGPRIGRNEPCPCGSGKKYKKCCGG